MPAKSLLPHAKYMTHRGVQACFPAIKRKTCRWAGRSISESLRLCVEDSVFNSTFGSALGPILKPMGTVGFCPLDLSPSSANVQNVWSYLHVFVRPSQLVIIVTGMPYRIWIQNGVTICRAQKEREPFLSQDRDLVSLKLAEHFNVMLIVQLILLFIIWTYIFITVITLFLAVLIPATFPLASVKFHHREYTTTRGNSSNLMQFWEETLQYC
jgi:hypothetical protein